MIENYYTPEQLDALEARRKALGDDRIRQAEAEWAELIAAVRTEMEKDTDPASEPVQRLARRWQELVQAFTGGDPGIARSLTTMYEQEGPAKASHGMLDPAVFEYAGRAIAALPRE